MGNPLSLDFRTPLVKIKSSHPDAVFIVTSDYNQCAFMKQMREIGLDAVKLGTESAGDDISLKNCPELLKGTYFSSPKTIPKGYDFISKFKDAYGDVPKFPSAVTAYDAVYVIANALKITNGVGGENLQKEIVKTNINGSAISKILFNQKGFLTTPEDAFTIMTVKDGQFVPAE